MVYFIGSIPEAALGRSRHTKHPAVNKSCHVWPGAGSCLEF